MDTLLQEDVLIGDLRAFATPAVLARADVRRAPAAPTQLYIAATTHLRSFRALSRGSELTVGVHRPGPTARPPPIADRMARASITLSLI